VREHRTLHLVLWTSDPKRGGQMLTRREFTMALAGAALGAARPASADEPRVSAAAAELYRKAFVLDCNTIASIGYQLDTPETIRAVRESGVTALKSTLGGANGSFEDAVADIAAAERLLETAPDAFLKVRTAADLDRAREQRKIGVVYSFEAASPLEDKVDRIELFRNLGVRVMQLTYNRRSPFGVGCLDGDDEGVTELGRQAIAKMNELGVALDLSHTNTRTTADGIALSKRPPVITHAGCRAVHLHPRNKEDRELKALADRGGVVGIYMLPYLTPSPKQPALADYVRHMEHALEVCGEDHVGIGTDVPFMPVGQADLENMRKAVEERKRAGISAPGEDRPPYIPEANTPRKIELVAAALLERGHPSRVVEKVLGANFRRVFGEIFPA
jgi:membrane dipeptidase